jgi:hypothetical protein
MRVEVVTMEVQGWSCGCCGHFIPYSDVEGLKFEAFANWTSKVTCPGCGAYTIQRAYDEIFNAGVFLIVTPSRVKRGGVKSGFIKTAI